MKWIALDMLDSKFAGKPDVDRAQHFAELQHAGQRYNDETPYTLHLKAVGAVLKRFGFATPELLSAAWLHDILEDTNTSYNDIKQRFGPTVAELVYFVTSEKGRNRKERNAKTYPELAEKAPWEARALKLADRIANVEYGAATDGKNSMYAAEFANFEKVLRYKDTVVQFDRGSKAVIETSVRDPQLETMWAYLTKLLT